MPLERSNAGYFGNHNRRSHGHASPSAAGRSPMYRAWESMKRRCLNRDCEQYPDYGGRGIQFCERWSDFANFLKDMGERPPGTTLDRENNNGHYEPGNCRWATARQQARNRRSSSNVEFRGKTQCIAAWCEELGLDYPSVVNRLTSGWTSEAAFTIPMRRPIRKIS